MATVTADDLQVVRPLGGVPFGNVSALPFSLIVASGIWADSDQATAIAVGDVLILGTLPKGMTLQDAILKVSTAFVGAGSTMTIGFKYVDGVDSVAVPEDADYFCAAVAWTAALVARASNTAVRPVTLPKAAYLTLTCNTAALTGAGTLDVSILGVCDQA